MGNSHGCGIARRQRRRLGSANAVTVAEEVEEPGSYEAACSAGPELRTFDAALRRCAGRAIAAVASGVEVRSLSLGSLRDVTGCLLDMNQEVVRVVLASRRDPWAWRSRDLFDLVEGYFDSTLHTLDFLAALDASLRRARDAQLRLHLALHQRDPDRYYARALVELRRFKAEVGDEPFGAEFFAAFRDVYARQLAITSKLRQRKRQLDGRIRSVRAWRRVYGVVFVTTFAALLVCSVVAAAVAAVPPVAAALAAAASLPVGSAGRWVDSLLKRYQEALRGHKEVVGAMQAGAFIAIEDLDNIRALVDRLEVHVGSVVNCVEFAERDNEEAVRLGIEDVTTKLEVFMKGVDDLGEQADRCSRDVRRARTMVLQRIIYPPT